MDVRNGRTSARLVRRKWRGLEHAPPVVIRQADGTIHPVPFGEHRAAILRSIVALDVGPPEGVNVAQHVANCTPESYWES